MKFQQKTIQYRSDATGQAWWYVDIDTHEISFHDNAQYKISGHVYPVDTMYFRDAYITAIRDIVFDLLKGKDF